MYRFYQWMAFFYIYCIFGWIWETSYVSVCERHYVNRGFLHGPVIPLYGSGAVAMLFLALPVKDNLALTYVVGVVGATLLELVTGWAMESIFKVKYWDYSKQKIQFRGYICLSSSLFWGFLTIALVRFLHAPVERFVLRQPDWLMISGVGLFTVGFTCDLVVSAKEALDLRKVLVAMEKLRAEIDEVQKELSLKLEQSREQWAKRMEQSRSQLELKLAALNEQKEIQLGEFQLAHRRLRRRHPSATTGKLEEWLAGMKKREERQKEEASQQS